MSLLDAQVAKHWMPEISASHNSLHNSHVFRQTPAGESHNAGNSKLLVGALQSETEPYFGGFVGIDVGDYRLLL